VIDRDNERLTESDCVSVADAESETDRVDDSDFESDRVRESVKVVEGVADTV